RKRADKLVEVPPGMLSDAGSNPAASTSFSEKTLKTLVL
ncbi:hypothetical protein HKBW3S25_01783, partial [Candidatus Hakubella thermalkaliphila]